MTPPTVQNSAICAPFTKGKRHRPLFALFPKNVAVFGAQIPLLLREALYPSGSEEKLMCIPFVRLRKIIDFCERHLERASLKILSVIWAIDFAWSEKWMAVKWVSEWDRPVRGPFFGWKKVAFWGKSCKKWPVTFTFGKGCKNRTVLNWRWWRHEEERCSEMTFWMR